MAITHHFGDRGVNFGTKKLRGIGGDLGGAVKGFKKAINDDTKEGEDTDKASEETVSETSDK